MTDIVERLRDADTTRRIGESYADTHERRQRDRNEAAAEIERLRAALREIDEIGRVAAQVPGPRNKLMEICARARAAMEVEMSDTLRERVARAMCALSGPPLCDEICIGCVTQADAAIALVLEAAARVAGDFPAYRHGNLAADPFAAAQQASDEIAAAIRALKEKTNDRQ